MPMAMSGMAVASVPDARSPIDAAWAQAMQQGSLEAFAQFAMTYPDSPYAEIAHARLSSPVAAAAQDTAPGMQGDANSISQPGFVPSSMMVV
jgi:hypothetical protein